MASPARRGLALDTRDGCAALGSAHDAGALLDVLIMCRIIPVGRRSIRALLCQVMLVSNLAVEQRFANGTQGRLMSWCPSKISDKKSVLASHPELVARFVKETAYLSKSELFSDLDHIDVIVRQETLAMVPGHPVMLQLCVVPVAGISTAAAATAALL